MSHVITSTSTMWIIKCFLIIYLVQVGSSCKSNEHLQYSLTVNKPYDDLNQQTIKYCIGNTLTIRCVFNTTDDPNHGIFKYTLFKCEDTEIKCSDFIYIKLNSSPNMFSNDFILKKSDNNSIFGCGILIVVSGKHIMHRRSKVYILRLYKPLQRSTTTSISSTDVTTISTTVPVTTDNAGALNSDRDKINWLMIGVGCGVLLAGVIGLAVTLCYKFKVQQSNRAQEQKTHMIPPHDHNNEDVTYADVYEDRQRIVNHALQELQAKINREQELELKPIKIMTKPIIPKHETIAPASDMYLLRIDSDGYQIPDEVRSKGIQYDMNNGL